jgi:hypothetical protein
VLYQGERRVGGKTAMLSATGEVVAEFNVTRRKRRRLQHQTGR